RRSRCRRLRRRTRPRRGETDAGKMGNSRRPGKRQNERRLLLFTRVSFGCESCRPICPQRLSGDGNGWRLQSVERAGPGNRKLGPRKGRGFTINEEPPHSPQPSPPRGRGRIPGPVRGGSKRESVLRRNLSSKGGEGEYLFSLARLN